MDKVDINPLQLGDYTMARLARPGCLLVTADNSQRANVMTIGWGMLGISWMRNVFCVMVRPSRFSYSLLESLGEFTVNVPDDSLNKAVSYCGTVSGRDEDKFAACKLTTQPSRSVNVPIITQCVVHYECKVVHRNDITATQLDEDIQHSTYPSSDFHRVYYGHIVSAYADSSLAQ